MYRWIGEISLNISLVLYLINYLPQLIHNYRGKHLSHLSIFYHMLLYLSSITDLFYGFALHMPWQYKMVSITCFSCLWIQHYQIGKAGHHRFFREINLFLMVVFCLCVLLIVFFDQDKRIFILFGYISQTAGITCALPQIFKNIKTSTALSLNVMYLMLAFLSHFCDNISAYFLSWPLPSKLGAFFSTVIFLILLFQWKRASVREQYA